MTQHGSVYYKQNRLKQLRAFCSTAQAGSISRAAETLFLSQPSVSLQIQARGQVTTFSEESAPGVTILARARLGEDSAGPNRSQEAVSSDMGAFAMSVDAGLYDMHVKMSSETVLRGCSNPSSR